jgi:hypothetical protein
MTEHRTPEAWPLADEDQRAAEEDAGGFVYGPRPRWQIAAAIVAIAVIVTSIVYTLGRFIAALIGGV